jgi:hypothetical protein
MTLTIDEFGFEPCPIPRKPPDPVSLSAMQRGFEFSGSQMEWSSGTRHMRRGARRDDRVVISVRIKLSMFWNAVRYWSMVPVRIWCASKFACEK